MINFGLLTWGPSDLRRRAFDLKQGGATFVIFLSGMFGSLTSGFLVDKLRARHAARTVYKRCQALRDGVMLSFSKLP